MRLRLVWIPVLALVCLCLAAIAFYYLPPVHARLAWRVENLLGEFQRWLNPPEELVFIPGGASGPGAVQTVAQATLAALLPSSTATASQPTAAAAQATASAPVGADFVPAQPTATETPLPSPTPTPTPLPARVLLPGLVHEYQQFNNCGPANLAMALSYWGWQGDQRDTRAFLRPNLEVDDKNVNPQEMVDFVEGYTGLKALTRVGGDLDLLQRLIAAGFPVIIEKGHDPRDDFWMGHYLVLNGYNAETAGGEYFNAQDSLIQPDMRLPYAELAASEWRDFNRVFVIPYAAEREAELAAILGPRFDPAESYRLAARQSTDEIPALQGRDLFFAWFALGSSLVGLQDYAGAADAYDAAFGYYVGLPEEERPYRLMWYQSGPYQAYYHTGRYEDVVSLANTTFGWVGKPVLEESFYWRGLAYAALGQQAQAIYDLKKAAELNPYFEEPLQELEKLGVAVP